MRVSESNVVTGEVIALSDGTTAKIRPIASGDAAALVRFHERLSPASITFRYFYPHLALGAAEVAHLTEVDGHDRVALVVERDGELIAVGRYDRLRDPAQAEVAFVVADAFQHQGIGTMLLHRLATRAKEAGIRLPCGRGVGGEQADALGLPCHRLSDGVNNCVWNGRAQDVNRPSSSGAVGRPRPARAR